MVAFIVVLRAPPNKSALFSALDLDLPRKRAVSSGETKTWHSEVSDRITRTYNERERANVFTLGHETEKECSVVSDAIVANALVQ